ncbi:MAG: GAF domain-containing protein [Ktedonobacteraceae bacterium]
MEKSRLLHKARELFEALERTTGDPGDLANTLKHIAQTAQQFFNADACAIFAMNPITKRFIASQRVAANLPKSNMEALEQPHPEWLAQKFLEQSVLVVEDLALMPELHNTFTRLEEVRSLAVLALRMKYYQRPLGALYLYFKQQQQFNTEDLEIFQFFADQTSFILQESWLLRRYQIVAHIGQHINQELATIDNLFQRLQKHIDDIVDISCAFLLTIYQPQTNTADLYVQEKGNFIQLKDKPLQGACKYVLETKKTLFIRQMSKEAEHLPFQLAPIPGTDPKESFIFVPLVLRDVPLGVLSIQHNRPDAYNQDDLLIIQLLANHIALTRHNIRLYDGLSLLNETGQMLTQQLDSEHTLQATVDKIREATGADIVVLYPYLAIEQHFALPPRTSGTLQASSPESMSPNQLDGIAVMMLQREKPIFAKQSTGVYSELGSAIHTQQENFAQRERISSTAVVPLRVKDEPVGVLFVNFRHTQRFDASQKLFIEGLAHYTAIAIKNSRVFGTLSQRRERELEILQYIDRELSRTLDLESVLNSILRLAHEQVPAEEASILLYNTHIQALEIPAAIGPHAETRLKKIIPLQDEKGIARWVLEHKKPARVDNVHNDPQWQDLYIQAVDDTVSELDVPLLDGEEVVGVLNFESTREAAFREEDEDFLLTLAGQAVLAIKNAQAYERERRLAEEGRVLNQISKEITSQLDYKHAFDLILEKALELTHSSLGALLLYDPNLNDLRIVAARGLTEDKRGIRLGLHQGIVGHVARNKQLVNVDVSHPYWKEIYVEFAPETRFELVAPLLAGNDLRGVINVESSFPNKFSESDERLLQGLADLAVVALQNAERYAQARREANRFELWYKAAQELSKITELTELEQAYDVILHIAEDYSQCQGVIYRYDDITEELVVRRTLQDQGFSSFRRMKLNEGLTGSVARERRTIVIHDIHNPPPGIVPAQLSDLTIRSLLVIPIVFKDRYYGNLELSHNDIDCFRDTDVIFFEGLAQQLATTIYRLETAQERQEFEHQVQSAEIMSSIGQVTFELTHRWGNDLGLIEPYVDDIRQELAAQAATNSVISKKLDNIVRVTQKVLDLSKRLKQELGKPGVPEIIPPRALLEEAQTQALPSLPSTIHIDLAIDDNVAHIRAVYSMVADILRNLLTNAIEAMPKGGKITLKAHNIGRFVALEVTDSGVGIPPQQQDKIFDLSFSTKGSSGFGLWSARTNALKNNGDLKVKSQVGQGTTFTLLLPKVEKGVS